MPQLLELGERNLDAIAETVAAQEIDCGFERSGALDVAVAPWQVEGLREVHEQALALGENSVLLDADETRSLVDSPTYLAGLLDEGGTAMVDPARLVWGLALAVESLGGRIVEQTPVSGWRDTGDRSSWSPAGDASAPDRWCWPPTSSPRSSNAPDRTSCRCGTTCSPRNP